jgi:hypothetical protein
MTKAREGKPRNDPETDDQSDAERAADHRLISQRAQNDDDAESHVVDQMPDKNDERDDLFENHAGRGKNRFRFRAESDQRNQTERSAQENR